MKEDNIEEKGGGGGIKKRRKERKWGKKGEVGDQSSLGLNH